MNNMSEHAMSSGISANLSMSLTSNFTTPVGDDNSTTARPSRSGYDLPVYGLDNGQLLQFHITALSCIFTSLACALATIIYSFCSHTRRFSQWKQGDRIIVYIALCDGLFNLAHSLDHLQYAIQRGHVTPPELCAFYGFMLAEFISAQNLMVLVAAVNACVLVHRRYELPFGNRDWRLLVFTFGVPFVFSCVVAATNGFGPTGAFCYYDGVRGKEANTIFTTTALAFVLVSCALLYVFTWLHIYRAARHHESVLGYSQLTASVLVAAKTCLLLVTAFFIQWWAIALYGTWLLVQLPPPLLFQLVTTFTNLGGVFNFVVFCVVYRRRLKCRRRQQAITSGANTRSNTSDDCL